MSILDKLINKSRVESIVVTNRKVKIRYCGSLYALEKRNKRKLKAYLRNQLLMTKKEIDEVIGAIQAQEEQHL